MNKNIICRHFKKCDVCGDVALSSNFCGISCESCRNFFRRNAQKNQELRCLYSTEQCHIDVDSRRHCARCRMNKCLAIGMKLELTVVKKIGNRRRAKLKTTSTVVQQNASQSNEVTQLTPNPDSKTNNNKALSSTMTTITKDSTVATTTTTKSETQQLNRLYLQAFEGICLEFIQNLCTVFQTYHPQVIGYAQDMNQAFCIQEFLLRATVKFCYCADGFRGLRQNDQLIILKNSFFEIMLIRTMFYFNFEIDSFQLRLDVEGQQAMYVPFGLLNQLKIQNLIDLYRKFAKIIKEGDNIIRDLMCVLTMFKERSNIACPEYLRYEFSRYRYLLERYLVVKYQSVRKAADIHCRLMQIVQDVSQLKEIFFEIYAHIDSHYSVSHSLLEVYEITDQ